MNKILVAAVATAAFGAPALAADLPVKAPPLVQAVTYNWSGCYVGGDVGATWNKVDINVPAYVFPNHSTHASSISGGVLAGCNYMLPNRFVFGIEGDFSWMQLNATALSGNGGTELFTTKYNEAASVRGRLGYSPESMPMSLWYVTAGWAWAHLRDSYYAPTPSAIKRVCPPAGHRRRRMGRAQLNRCIGISASMHKTESQFFFGPNTLNLTEDPVRARFSCKFEGGALAVARYRSSRR